MRLEQGSQPKPKEKKKLKPDVKVINKSQIQRMASTTVIRPQRVKVQTLELPYFQKTDNFKQIMVKENLVKKNQDLIQLKYPPDDSTERYE